MVDLAMLPKAVAIIMFETDNDFKENYTMYPCISEAELEYMVSFCKKFNRSYKVYTLSAFER